MQLTYTEAQEIHDMKPNWNVKVVLKRLSANTLKEMGL
jgi:hypothetical protein